jgi:hypothetical protein
MTRTAEQQEDADYVAGLLTENETFVHDFSDERQYRHLVQLLNETGLTPKTRPGLHAGLAKAREVHAADGPRALPVVTPDGFASGPVITDVTSQQGGTEAAGFGFAGFDGGALQTNAILQVTDTANPSAILASGRGSDFGNGTYVPVPTAPVAPPTPSMTATLSVFYQLTKDSPWQAASTPRTVPFNVQKDPTVVHPVRKPGRTHPELKRIIIAIGRGKGTQADVDYWLAWDQQHTAYELPFVGNVDFAANVVTPLVLNTNVFIFGNLARDSFSGKGGHKYLPVPEQQHIFSTLQASGTNLSWNLPPPAQNPPTPPPTPDHGNTIHWGELNFASGEIDYLTIQFVVALQGNVWGYATVQSYDTPDVNPLDGTTKILPLSFVYSCLAAGTPVRMADGSEKPIELIERDDAVRGADGSVRTVAFTRITRHRGPVLRLTTDAGELVLSRNHPVLTPGGPRLAEELALGDEVTGESGTATVTRVCEESFDGRLCNLSTTPPGEQPDLVDNFIANGVAVGGYELQTQREYDRRLSKEAVLARLGPEYHQDYLNFLEEAAASA